MSRVETLRRMGLDWAADLVESLMADRAKHKAEIEDLTAEKLRLKFEVARIKKQLRESVK